MVEYVIGDGACSVSWSSIAGKRGITVIGFEARRYVVTGYQAFGWRQFQEDSHGHSHVVTTMQLRLDIQQDGGPPGRRATLAVIDFGAGAADQIGQIAPRPDPHAEQFELDVALTAADFDHYWNILTDIGQTHLRCEVQVPPGEDIVEFEIVSRKHTEAAP
jgi:hypothetical protein